MIVIGENGWLVDASQRLPIVGRSFGVNEFPRYLAGLRDEAFSWTPRKVMVHNTAAPSLAQRPDGLTRDHLRNIRSYYLRKNWNHGPHLFVDDDEVWTFSPLTDRGTHSPSYNRSAIGVELLGNYDWEDPKSGRGRDVLSNGIMTVGFLLDRFGLEEEDIVFHWEDPATDHGCPGELLSKGEFVEAVERFRRHDEFLW